MVQVIQFVVTNNVSLIFMVEFLASPINHGILNNDDGKAPQEREHSY
jgi:hypothetical protein